MACFVNRGDAFSWDPEYFLLKFDTVKKQLDVVFKIPAGSESFHDISFGRNSFTLENTVWLYMVMTTFVRRYDLTDLANP